MGLAEFLIYRKYIKIITQCLHYIAKGQPMYAKRQPDTQKVSTDQNQTFELKRRQSYEASTNQLNSCTGRGMHVALQGGHD